MTVPMAGWGGEGEDVPFFYLTNLGGGSSGDFCVKLQANNDYLLEEVLLENYDLGLSKTIENEYLGVSRVVCYKHHSVVGKVREELMDGTGSSYEEKISCLSTLQGVAVLGPSRQQF